MTEAEILDQVAEVLQDTFDRDDLSVTRETTATDIAEWDSFNHINIIVACELRFGVKFKTAELERLRDVGELVDLIGKKLAS